MVPLFLWEQGKVGFFRNLLVLSLCAVASLLAVFVGISFGCENLIFFHVGMLIIIDSAPESNKKSISRSGG